MKKIVTLLNLLLFFAFPALVYAAPPKLSDIGQVVDNVYSILSPAAGLLAVGMIVMGAYTWMTSGGDSAKKQEAQGTITWSVFGLIFLFIFKFILVAVFDFLAK